jgi:hypothetical protein
MNHLFIRSRHSVLFIEQKISALYQHKVFTYSVTVTYTQIEHFLSDDPVVGNMGSIVSRLRNLHVKRKGPVNIHGHCWVEHEDIALIYDLVRVDQDEMKGNRNTLTTKTVALMSQKEQTLNQACHHRKRQLQSRALETVEVGLKG